MKGHVVQHHGHARDDAPLVFGMLAQLRRDLEVAFGFELFERLAHVRGPLGQKLGRQTHHGRHHGEPAPRVCGAHREAAARLERNAKKDAGQSAHPRRVLVQRDRAVEPFQGEADLLVGQSDVPERHDRRDPGQRLGLVRPLGQVDVDRLHREVHVTGRAPAVPEGAGLLGQEPAQLLVQGHLKDVEHDVGGPSADETHLAAGADRAPAVTGLDVLKDDGVPRARPPDVRDEALERVVEHARLHLRGRQVSLERDVL